MCTLTLSQVYVQHTMLLLMCFYFKILSGTLSNCLDPDQDIRSELGPKCLQRLSEDGKSRR